MVNLISNFLEAGIKLILVVDGPNKPPKKNSPKTYSNDMIELTSFRYIAEALGVLVVDADGEGEAQCAHMQRSGVVDYAYTEDSDVIIFGARKIMRKLHVPFGAPKNQPRLYKVYHISESHTWASPEKLLCYSVLRGGDYHTRAVSDAVAANIAVSGEWAKMLYAICLTDPIANVALVTAKKEKALLQWTVDLQKSVTRTIVAPKLHVLTWYAFPRVVKTYSFTKVPEFHVNVNFFLVNEWIEKDVVGKMMHRLARMCMVQHLKTINDSQFITFINPKDKSCEKDEYGIKYCLFYMVQYPSHRCTGQGCHEAKVTVSASVLMQSKYDYHAVYANMAGGKKGVEASRKMRQSTSSKTSKSTSTAPKSTPSTSKPTSTTSRASSSSFSLPKTSLSSSAPPEMPKKLTSRAYAAARAEAESAAASEPVSTRSTTSKNPRNSSIGATTSGTSNSESTTSRVSRMSSTSSSLAPSLNLKRAHSPDDSFDDSFNDSHDSIDTANTSVSSHKKINWDEPIILISDSDSEDGAVGGQQPFYIELSD